MGHFLDSVFQPIYEISKRTLQPVGYEAFLRPVAGKNSVSPASYFEALEKEDKSFADQLCRELHIKNFLKQNHNELFISLNVAPSSLEHHIVRFEDLQRQISSGRNQGLPATQMMIELDMSPELDAGVIFTYAEQLRSLGIGVTLEDFDADCASFSRIVHNRPNVVKFSRSWIDGAFSGHGIC